jgi:hypothetical protein
MARLLCINIEYKNKNYMALVNVRQKDNDLTCQVRYIDSSLHCTHSGELLVFDLSEGIRQQDNLHSNLVKTLRDSTIKAIRKHLQFV